MCEEIRFTFGEIEVGNNIDFHRGCVYRRGIQMPPLREYNKDFRWWEWQLLDLWLDTVLPAGGERRGGFTRENPLRRTNGCGDDYGDITIVLDLEAGYRVHSCVREPCAVRLADNVLGIVQHWWWLSVRYWVTRGNIWRSESCRCGTTKRTYMFGGEWSIRVAKGSGVGYLYKYLVVRESVPTTHWHSKSLPDQQANRHQRWLVLVTLMILNVKLQASESGVGVLVLTSRDGEHHLGDAFWFGYRHTWTSPITKYEASPCVLENPWLNVLGSVHYVLYEDEDLIDNHKSVLFSAINTPGQVKNKSHDTAQSILLISTSFWGFPCQTCLDLCKVLSASSYVPDKDEDLIDNYKPSLHLRKEAHKWYYLSNANDDQTLSYLFIHWPHPHQHSGTVLPVRCLKNPHWARNLFPSLIYSLLNLH